MVEARANGVRVQTRSAHTPFPRSAGWPLFLERGARNGTWWRGTRQDARRVRRNLGAWWSYRQLRPRKADKSEAWIRTVGYNHPLGHRSTHGRRIGDLGAWSDGFPGQREPTNFLERARAEAGGEIGNAWTRVNDAYRARLRMANVCGYDLAERIKQWLKENRHTALSLCEVVLTDSALRNLRPHVGAANVFWSHIQSEPLLERGGRGMDFSRDCDLRPGTLHNIWGSFAQLQGGELPDLKNARGGVDGCFQEG